MRLMACIYHFRQTLMRNENRRIALFLPLDSCLRDAHHLMRRKGTQAVNRSTCHRKKSEGSGNPFCLPEAQLKGKKDCNGKQDNQ